MIKSVGQIARELDLTDSVVRSWVKAAELDDGNAQVEQDVNLHAELRAAKRRIRGLELERRSQNGRGPPPEGGLVTFEFIHQERASSIAMLCRVLDVLRNSYYRWRSAVPS